MTYLFVNVTYLNCSPIPYVDQVWWWYVKAFMSYAWQNWQTNRQTDRQTNRQTNILAKNCKFCQVMRRQEKEYYKLRLDTNRNNLKKMWSVIRSVINNCKHSPTQNERNLTSVQKLSYEQDSAAAAAYQPVQKHLSHPSIPGGLNYLWYLTEYSPSCCVGEWTPCVYISVRRGSLSCVLVS